MSVKRKIRGRHIVVDELYYEQPVEDVFKKVERKGQKAKYTKTLASSLRENDTLVVPDAQDQNDNQEVYQDPPDMMHIDGTEHMDVDEDGDIRLPRRLTVSCFIGE